jgi:hypothetical protein
VWDSAPELPRSGGKVRRAVEAMARSGSRTGRPLGVLEALWGRIARSNFSVEEMALLVLLVAMVGFVIHWLSLMFG